VTAVLQPASVSCVQSPAPHTRVVVGRAPRRRPSHTPCVRLPRSDRARCAAYNNVVVDVQPRCSEGTVPGMSSDQRRTMRPVAYVPRPLREHPVVTTQTTNRRPRPTKGSKPSHLAEQMDEAILESATLLFAAKGYSGTSTREIGERVGLDKTSLYYYFRSKEEILFRVIARLRDKGEMRMKQIAEMSLPPDERLAAAMRAHAVELRDHRDEAKVFLEESRHIEGRHRNELAQYRRAYEQQIEQIIQEGQEDGLFDKGINSEMATRGILSMLNGLFSARHPIDPSYIDESTEVYVRVALAGMRPQRAPKTARKRTRPAVLTES